jgi:hypothetical protein
MSKVIKKIWKDPNHIYNDKEHQKKRNKILSKAHSKPETKKLRSKIMKEKWKDKNSGLNNSKRSEGASESMIKVWSSLSEEERNQWCINCSVGWTEEKRIEKSKVAKQKWSEDDYRIKMKDGRHNSPNKEEEQLEELLNNLFPNEYKFVGNFDLFINGKNPDFVNILSKKVIEYFGSYWHSELMTGEKEYIHENKRINHFINSGYNCLIIWDFEFKNKKELIKKLKKFNQEIL